MSGQGIPVTFTTGGAPVTITNLDASMIEVEGGGTVQEALDNRQPLDADLTAIAGLTSAADKLPYFTGANAAALADFSAAGRALVDDADAAAQRATLGLYGVGTSFPGTPAADDLFYRTDRDLMYFYDGSRWLSTWIGELRFRDAAASASSFDSYSHVPFLGTYGLYLERFYTSYLRVGAGEWDIILSWYSLTNAQTVLLTVDGAGATDTNWIAASTAIGAVLDANAKAFKVSTNEISGTSTLYGGSALTYRLIG